jgi:hypothetical protein
VKFFAAPIGPINRAGWLKVTQPAETQLCELLARICSFI